MRHRLIVAVAALAVGGGISAGVAIAAGVGDDGAAYGVEVRLADGRVVEVELDERSRVIGTENDDDGANDSSDDSDDR